MRNLVILLVAILMAACGNGRGVGEYASASNTSSARVDSVALAQQHADSAKRVDDVRKLRSARVADYHEYMRLDNIADAPLTAAEKSLSMLGSEKAAASDPCQRLQIQSKGVFRKNFAHSANVLVRWQRVKFNFFVF